MAIVSGIKFQAKIGEVNELEDGLKEYVSLAKKVGSTMALIRPAVRQVCSGLLLFMRHRVNWTAREKRLWHQMPEQLFRPLQNT